MCLPLSASSGPEAALALGRGPTLQVLSTGVLVPVLRGLRGVGVRGLSCQGWQQPVGSCGQRGKQEHGEQEQKRPQRPHSRRGGCGCTCTVTWSRWRQAMPSMSLRTMITTGHHPGEPDPCRADPLAGRLLRGLDRIVDVVGVGDHRHVSAEPTSRPCEWSCPSWAGVGRVMVLPGVGRPLLAGRRRTGGVADCWSVRARRDGAHQGPSARRGHQRCCSGRGCHRAAW